MIDCITKDNGPSRVNRVGGLFHSCHDKTDLEAVKVGQFRATRRMDDPSMTWSIEDGTRRSERVKGLTLIDIVGRLHNLHENAV